MTPSRAKTLVVFIAAGLVALGWPGGALALPVIFVDADATGPVHDGSTWCQAYTSLSEAIDAAVSGVTIRVADGTYKPDSAGLVDPRDATFGLVDGVAIEGGYAGCGSPNPNARDPAVYVTTLDGDLNGDDVAPLESDCFEYHETTGCDNAACEAHVCSEEPICCEPNSPNRRWFPLCVGTAWTLCCDQNGMRCDNSRHVVTADGTDDTAVLDGMVITRGYASGDGLTIEVLGGGVLVPKQANNGSWFDGGAGRGRGARTVRGADCGGAVGLGLCLGHRTFLLGQGPMRAGTSLSRRQGMALNSARAWPFAA